MAGDGFEKRYAAFMDNMLKSAVAETTKIFESTVDELKAEISRMKKENDVLKSKFEEMSKGSAAPAAGESAAEERQNAERRDTGIQCDLVSLQMHLEDHCYYEQSTSSSVQNLEQRDGHEQIEDLQMELSYEKSVEGNHQEELLQPALVHKRFQTKIRATPGEGSSCVKPKHLSINQTSSCQVMKSPKTDSTQAGLITICNGEDNGRSCERAAQSEAPKLMYQPVVILCSLKDNMKGTFEAQTLKIPKEPATTETQMEHKTVIEEVPSVVTEEQLVQFHNEQNPSVEVELSLAAAEMPVVQTSNEEQPSVVTQQNENGIMIKEQFNVAKQPQINVNASLMPEKLSEATPFPKASEGLEVAPAEIEVGSLTDASPQRKRGRPPKKNKHRSPRQQPANANGQLPSNDFPAVHIRVHPPLIGVRENTASAVSEGTSAKPHSPRSSSRTASLVPSLAQTSTAPPASQPCTVPHQEAAHQVTPGSQTFVLSRKQTSCSVVHGQSNPKVRQKDYTVFIPKTKTLGTATGTTRTRVQSQLQNPINPSIRVVTQKLQRSVSTALPSQEQPTVVLRSAQSLEPHPHELSPQQSGGSGKLNKHNTVTWETAVAGHALSNFKSASPGFVQSNFSPKVTSIVQNTKGAVVQLTKLWLPPLEVSQPSTISTSAAEPCYNFNDSLISQRVETSVSHITQNNLSAVVKSPPSSPLNPKGAELLSSTSASFTRLCKLKVAPISRTTQASVLTNLSNYLTKKNGTREKPSAVETSCPGFLAHAEPEAPDSKTSTLSDENLLVLSESEESDVECMPIALSAKMPEELQGKPSTSFTLTQQPGTLGSRNSAVSETSAPATNSHVSLNNAPTSESVEAQGHANLQRERSSPPIRLTNVFNDPCSPHSQMTKTLFLAQLAMLPVCHEQQKISSSGVGTKYKDRKAKKRVHNDPSPHGHTSSLLATIPILNAEPLLELVHCPKKPRLAEDGVGHTSGRCDKLISRPNNTNEPTFSPEKPGIINCASNSKNAPNESDSPNRYTIIKGTLEAIPENVTNEPVLAGTMRSRSTKTASDKPTNNPCLVSPRRSRLTKDDNSPQQKTSKPTAVRPRRSSSIINIAGPNKTPSEFAPIGLRSVSEKSATSSKKATSERSAASSRRFKSANSATSSKKRTMELTVSPRRSTSVNNGCSSKKRTQEAAVGPRVSTLENKDNTPKTTRKPTAFNRKGSQRTLFKDDAKHKACNEQTLPSCSRSSFADDFDGLDQTSRKHRSSQDRIPSTSKKDTRGGNVPRAAKVLAKRNLKQAVVNEVAQDEQPTNSASTKIIKMTKIPIIVTLATNNTPQRIYPPSIASPPILGRGPPIVSPSQPLSVIGTHLLKNQCGECGCVLSSAAALKSHVSSHRGDQPFSCKVCGKLFPDMKRLNRHRRVHQNGRIHKCPECDKGFVYRFGVKQHVMLVHRKTKPFVCPFCNKNFFTKAEGDAHVRSHTGERPFPCTLCDKRFKRRVSLNVHLRWHNGEKRYWCSYCGKGFLDKNNLKFHLFTHTGERPYSCNICDKKFIQTSHLKKHLRNVHMVLDT